MKISLSKKKHNILLVVLNLFSVAMINFVMPLGFKSTSIDAFANQVADRAKSNKTNKVIFSKDVHFSDKKTILTFFDYNDKKHELKYLSNLVSPASRYENTIEYNGKKILTSSIFKERIYANQSDNGTYKMQSDELWYFNAPVNYSVGESKKSISISESIANILLTDFGLYSYEELNGKEIQYTYFDSFGTEVSDLFYVRGVLIDDRGNMPFYKNLYGENIILMYHTHLEYALGETHFYFGTSWYRNSFNFNVLDQIQFTELTARYAENLTNNDAELTQAYNIYRSNPISKAIVFISLITFLAVFVFLVLLNGLFISKFKKSLSVFALVAFLVLITNELVKVLLSTFKFNFFVYLFMNPLTGVFLIIYVVSSFVVYGALKGRRMEKNEANC